jgi:hypothetical protein
MGPLTATEAIVSVTVAIVGGLIIFLILSGGKRKK